jgi:hypothetical protein
MWNKQQIQTLKEKAYFFCGDDCVRKHLTAINVHLSNYERQLLVHSRNEEWREAEGEADQIKSRLLSMNVDLQSLN